MQNIETDHAIAARWRRFAAVAAFAVAAASYSARSYAGLIITPTFDSSITNDPNAAAIESTINSAIGFYESYYTNPINVTIDFQEMNSGLGESEWGYYNVSYHTFITDLTNTANHAPGPTPLTGALAYQPTGTTNPVNGDTTINIKSANGRAIGLNTPAAVNVGGNFYDGVVSLNIGETTIDGGQYSLISTAEHEMDEVLGLGSALPTNSLLHNDPLPEDLYRYTEGPSGSRSYTTAGDDAYFSIDGGNTDLVQFNQDSGGDYGDWWSNNGGGNPGPNPPTRVQDAYAYPNRAPTLGVELTALDVIGYTPAPVPEPGSLALVTLGVLAIGGWRGFKLASRQKL